MNFKPTVRRRQSGISLVETLVYISCLSLLLTFLSLAVWKLSAYHDSVNARADIVAKLLETGEAWRDEVRGAGELSVDSAGGLKYTKAGKPCAYQLSTGHVVRSVDGTSEVLLKRVVASKMSPLERDGVRYWQWDITVATGTRGSELTFSFLAVPKKEAK